MNKTTVFKPAADVERRSFPKCHDGEGSVDWSNVLAPAELKGCTLHFFHDNRMDPGVSIGVHSHDSGEEYYYILEGQGVMILDGVEHLVGPGDITACYAGGNHGLRNDSTSPLRVIVFALKSTTI